MILKALELQGFKSFPDKTVLELEKGITAVVGPNGSGKSNISDAIRWVLGEQSTKSLRGAKMEDVIFSGNDGGRKAHGFAQVTLRLDNSDKTLNNCDEDEVEVTRRYYRSGDSEYLLNGEGVRLRDIHELFMDTGLGRDGYSMVSQGRIADLISSKSGQRREMLEEAAGISHFRYRRSDASRKLDQAQENLLRLHDILSELEARVGPLKTQSEKAQKFITYSTQKRELEIGLWLHTIEKSKESLKQQEDKLTIAKAQYESVESDLQRLESEIEKVSKLNQDITISIDFIHQSTYSYEEEATKIDGQIAVEKNTIEHNKETIERIKNDLNIVSNSFLQVDESVKAEEELIEKIKKQIEEKYELLSNAGNQISSIRGENEKYTDEILQLTAETEKLNVDLSDSRVKRTTAQSSIEEIKSRLETVDDTLFSRQEMLEKITQQKANQQTELEDTKIKAEEIANSISGYEILSKTKREKLNNLSESVGKLEMEIHQKSSRAKMLDDLEKNMEGYSGSVKAVMKEQKRGTLKGIHAPLSQIINTPEKYAAAIETAFGAAIQHIVTDNEHSAKKAISFLKENRLGRATFLPLTAIKSKPFPDGNLEDEFGFIDMADKLVSFDEKYSEIIRYQLGHIAVAEDMDCAIAIAKKHDYKFRIVTLDGQIINSGGSMTGGSRGHNSGILSRANEIEKLNANVQKLTEELNVVSKEHKIVKEDLALADATLSAAQADYIVIQEDIIRKESELKLTMSQFESIKNGIEELSKEKQNSDMRIEIFTSALTDSDEKIKELCKDISALQEKISALHENREKLLQGREELSKLEGQINMDILSFQKDIQAKEESISHLKASILDNDGRVNALKNEIVDIEIKNETIILEIENLSKKALQLREKSKQSKSEISSLIERRSECEKRSVELRREEKEKTAEREKISGELARLEERKASYQKEFEDTINKLYDEYQLSRREAEEIGIVLEDPAKAHRELMEIKGKIRSLGSVNTGAIEEYKEVSERYEFLKEQIEDIEKSKDELNKLIGELTSKMSVQFRAQFNKINTYFGETFAELFGGGKAELILENPLDVLECNIEIKVQPPGKNVKNIDLLSGGEKGLSAIALLFAILKVTPAPFCIFDEVEAALDDVNVSKYAQYVRRMTCNTQFILITHRRGTMEEADVLYGVTMQEEGVSKMLELKTAEMAKKLGLA